MINPTADPLRLEIKNPNIIRGHCFLSIFDLIASNGINLFRIRRGRDDYLTDKEIDDEYKKAIDLLKKPSTKKFITTFCTILEFSSRDIDQIIKDAEVFLNELQKTYTINDIGGKPKTSALHTWLVKAADDYDDFQAVTKIPGFAVTKARKKENMKVLEALEQLKESYEKYFPNDKSIENATNDLKGDVFG